MTLKRIINVSTEFSFLPGKNESTENFILTREKKPINRKFSCDVQKKVSTEKESLKRLLLDIINLAFSSTSLFPAGW